MVALGAARRRAALRAVVFRAAGFDRPAFRAVTFRATRLRAVREGAGRVRADFRERAAFLAAVFPRLVRPAFRLAIGFPSSPVPAGNSNRCYLDSYR
jgi:hypothetical protein